MADGRSASLWAGERHAARRAIATSAPARTTNPASKPRRSSRYARRWSFTLVKFPIQKSRSGSGGRDMRGMPQCVVHISNRATRSCACQSIWEAGGRSVVASWPADEAGSIGSKSSTCANSAKRPAATSQGSASRAADRRDSSFLIYQRLHGAWLTPRYNKAAFRDHTSALAPAVLAPPSVHVSRGRHLLRIDYRHAPSPARRPHLRRACLSTRLGRWRQTQPESPSLSRNNRCTGASTSNARVATIRLPHGAAGARLACPACPVRSRQGRRDPDPAPPGRRALAAELRLV